MKIRHTYFKHRINNYILLLVLYILSTIPANGTGRINQEKDSLKLILTAQSDPQIIMPVLSRLSILHSQQPEEVNYLERLLNEALQTDSISLAYFALAGLSRYYYNSDNRDSLMHWVNYVDSMAKARKEYPDVFFDAKSYSCQNLLWSKNYTLALNEAMDLYTLANANKKIYGLARCSESLGLIYQTIRRDSDAIVAFQESLDLLKAIDNSLEAQVRIISYQAECVLRTDMFDKAKNILANYEQHIHEYEKVQKDINQLPVKREYWLLYCMQTLLYTKENQLEKAKEALDKATIYAGNIYVEGDYAEKIYLYVQAYYYKKIGNTSLALRYINELLEIEHLPENLQLKADILIKEKKIKEALLLYDEIYDLKNKRNNETLRRQINQLRTLHEVRNKETQDRELEIGSQQIIQKQHLLIVSAFVIIALVILLYILFLFFSRTKHLKNELQKEKESLLKSENNLRQEIKKVTEASRTKSAFVANMSHEIRTPLNAIVGFSNLLTNSATLPEEKEEYSTIIKNNTTQLLNLINDVLDISRMETGSLHFKMDSYLLTDCCQQALNSIRHQIPPKVVLTYTPESDPIIVYTDTLRLQQLLTNLLTNAIKFTKEGEINLSFKLENGNVHIAVTDTGCGIPLQKQADVFKRFKKLNEFKQGTGLGLSICGMIAKQLGGTIFIDPTYKEGTRFIFIHPVKAS